MSEMCVNLTKWQKEFIESNDKEIILNWCRGAGTTFSLMIKILRKKPQTVLFYSNRSLNALHNKINEIKKFIADINLSIDSMFLFSNKLQIIYKDKTRTTIYIPDNSNKDDILNHVHYIIFDGCLPYVIDYKANQTISLLNINNYDKKLQKLCPKSKIIEVDYSDEDIRGKKYLNTVKQNIKTEHDLITYYNEYELLSKPLDNLISYPDTRRQLIEQSIQITPDNMFLIDTLINLQNEYDNTPCNKDTILTRKNLLDMIMCLQRDLGFFLRKNKKQVI